MLKMVQPKHQSILGIDITSTSVKVLEISSVEGKLIVEHYGREVLPIYAMDGNSVKDIDAVSQSIKNLIKRLHIKCRRVALALPDAEIISKIIEINEGLTDEEMEEFIISEAYQYIPYSINEVNLDFEILGSSKKNPHRLKVLVVASRTENVNKRIEIAARAGLNAVVVDGESYAVERAVVQFSKDLPVLERLSTFAVIDIGATYIHVFVVHAKKLVYCRQEKFAGKQLMETIAKNHKISFDQAESFKEQIELPLNFEQELLNPFKENLIVQIKRSLHFYYSEALVQDVDYIILAGGLAKLPGLVSLVQKRLGMTATVANPFSQMTLGKMVHRDSMNHDAPMLIVAYGLALRSIG